MNILELLIYLTAEYPPGDKRNHCIFLNAEKSNLVIGVWFNGVSYRIFLDDINELSNLEKLKKDINDIMRRLYEENI